MLYFLLLVLLSIGPGILWLWYFYRMDRHDPEPRILIFRLFGIGMLLTPVAALLERYLGTFLSELALEPIDELFVSAFFVVALVEEGLKCGSLWLLTRKNPAFNESADGIIYGISVGLGFASLENLFWAQLYGYKIALVRAVITSLAHISFSGCFGYYLSLSRINKKKSLLLFNGIAIAIAAHGLYDFFLFLENFYASVGSFLLLIIVFFRLYTVLHQLIENSPLRSS